MTTYIIKEKLLKDRHIDVIRAMAHFLASSHKNTYIIYRCTPIIEVKKDNETQYSSLNYEDLYAKLIIELDKSEKQVEYLKSELKKKKEELTIANEIITKRTLKDYILLTTKTLLTWKR